MRRSIVLMISNGNLTRDISKQQHQQQQQQHQQQQQTSTANNILIDND